MPEKSQEEIPQETPEEIPQVEEEEVFEDNGFSTPFDEEPQKVILEHSRKYPKS